jgi:hypothetical protein
MAHMARGEGYREEQTSDEDGIVSRHGRGKVLMATDEYIESGFCCTSSFTAFAD